MPYNHFDDKYETHPQRIPVTMIDTLHHAPQPQPMSPPIQPPPVPHPSYDMYPYRAPVKGYREYYDAGADQVKELKQIKYMFIGMLALMFLLLIVILLIRK